MSFILLLPRTPVIQQPFQRTVRVLLMAQFFLHFLVSRPWYLQARKRSIRLPAISQMVDSNRDNCRGTIIRFLFPALSELHLGHLMFPVLILRMPKRMKMESFQLQVWSLL